MINLLRKAVFNIKIVVKIILFRENSTVIKIDKDRDIEVLIVLKIRCFICIKGKVLVINSKIRTEIVVHLIIRIV